MAAIKNSDLIEGVQLVDVEAHGDQHGTDEFGVAWDDEDANLHWDISGELIMSERDRNNPQMSDIPAGQLPR